MATNIISNKDYQKFVENLISPDTLINGNISKLSAVGLGLAGEIGEIYEVLQFYDKEKFIKECGDLLWYITLGCITLGIDLDDLMLDDTVNVDKSQQYLLAKQLKTLIIEIGSVCEIIKKHLFHKKELNNNTLILYLHSILNTLIVVCMYYDISIDLVKQTNYEKLSQRYPQGVFTVVDFNRKEER